MAEKRSMTASKSQAAQTNSSRESLAEFVVIAPKAESVSIAGTFNHWNTNALKLTKDYKGNWRGSLRLKPGRYEYRFFVDGDWRDDPLAKATIGNAFGSKNAILEIK